MYMYLYTCTYVYTCMYSRDPLIAHEELMSLVTSYISYAVHVCMYICMYVAIQLMTPIIFLRLDLNGPMDIFTIICTIN